jgi:tellurite methyltransferase
VTAGGYGSTDVRRLEGVEPRPAGYEGRFDAIGWYVMSRVGRLRRTLPRRTPRLIDLGMGRGRDAIYFARRGFRATGIELDPSRIRRAVARASRLQVPLRARRADLRTVQLREKYDVVYSSCALNHLPVSLRRRRFASFKAATRPGGIHAVSVFLGRPGVAGASDRDPTERAFRPGELRSYYRDWEILAAERRVFPCRWTGKLHRHPVDIVVARRPGGPPREDR